MTTFADLGVRERTLASLERTGVREPLPVQSDVIPVLLDGRDAVVEAPTGSGKTLAFGLPLIDKLRGHRSGGPRALIVVPTRELAVQVTGVIAALDRDVRVATLHGGVGYAAQLTALRRGADCVVGCPGRILDLAGTERLVLGHVGLLVLDEADEMLDAGFARDVERIIDLCSRPQRQTVLASATMPEWVQRMVDKHLREPVRIRVDAVESQLEHAILPVDEPARADTLATVLRARPEGSGSIVFTRTKHGATKLAKRLNGAGLRAADLTGNLSQNARDRSLASFRAGRVGVLVATNVAARGIDVSHVGLVVNYELPETAQWLTHRIGRTARNGAEGRAVTFLSATDSDKWRKLRRGGAPALPHLDAQAFLDRGEWNATAVAEPAVSRAEAPRATRRPGSGSWRARPAPRHGAAGAPRGQGRPAR